MKLSELLVGTQSFQSDGARMHAMQQIGKTFRNQAMVANAEKAIFMENARLLLEELNNLLKYAFSAVLEKHADTVNPRIRIGITLPNNTHYYLTYRKEHPEPFCSYFSALMSQEAFKKVLNILEIVINKYESIIPYYLDYSEKHLSKLTEFVIEESELFNKHFFPADSVQEVYCL